jgi:hypothetical protein
MPSRRGLRPLKAWRYIGVYGPDLMLCVGAVRVGPARQAFWAVWDRARSRLHQRTALGSGGVLLDPGRVRVHDRDLQLDLTLEETAGIESVCRSGEHYAWTRKQGGIRAFGRIAIGGEPRLLAARSVVDDAAGVGLARDGRQVAWNLVSGVNDPPSSSERTVWLDGEPRETGPCTFASGELSRVDALRFDAEAVRERRENLLLIRSAYRQPFGTFSGELPGGIVLAEGYGVMEAHEARW